MARLGMKRSYSKRVKEFLSQAIEEKLTLPLAIPLVLLAWALERWLAPFSNFVLLIMVMWAAIEYGRIQRKLIVERLNRRWRQILLNAAPMTPKEPCEWLNKLLMEVWPNYMELKLARKFSSIVERRLKKHRPNFVEKMEVQEFYLGSCPPILGQQGIRWITSGREQAMCLGFDWETDVMSVAFLAKLSKPLIGTARIILNSLHIKGELLLVPVLDGQAILYSFQSTPEVRMNLAFGNGGSQNVPGMELPGVSSWLVKLLTETIVKTMVEPRRLCYLLQSSDHKKKVVGGNLSVVVVSASNICSGGMRSDNSSNWQSFAVGNKLLPNGEDKVLKTFVEVEIGNLIRKTDWSEGSSPRWNCPFNMFFHGESGVVKFLLYEQDTGGIKFNCLTQCEIKIKYMADGSTIYWAIGPESSVIAKHAETCGQEIMINVPFEDDNMGELSVILVLKEWQFTDGSVSTSNFRVGRSPVQHDSLSSHFETGRKLVITVIEARGLSVSNKQGKCDPYVKLQYGKTICKTKALSRTFTPVWNHRFEFDEISGGDYLKVKCYSSDLFRDENIGSAYINLEGIAEGSSRDFWVPLEKSSAGEIRLQVEAMEVDEVDDGKVRKSSAKVRGGLLELVIVEARELVAADFGGTSDPYVRVHYGKTKKRTKVIYKTVTPYWNQTLEFPDTGEPLTLYVKDHNAILPEGSIGRCTVEYQSLPPNQTADKWIPLQGVRNGEIHVKVTRRVSELKSVVSAEAQTLLFRQSGEISKQMRSALTKVRALIEDGDPEMLSLALADVESLEDAWEESMLQTEREKALLLSKINELGNEISRTSSVPANLPL